MNKRIAILVFITLILTEFWDLVSIPRSLRLVILFGLFLYGYKQNKETVFNKAIFTYFAGLGLSIVSSFLFRDQSIAGQVVSLNNFWQIGLVFLFASPLFSAEELKKALLWIGYLTTGMYLLQYELLQVGITLRDLSDDLMEDSETARMRINCSASIFYIFFYNIQCWFRDRHKLWSLIWIGLTGAVALILNFRSLMLVMVLVAMWELWMLRVPARKLTKAAVIVIPLIFLVTTTDFFQQKMDMITYRVDRGDSLNNANYDRVRAMEYYMEEHFDNFAERILGTGIPDGKSRYSRMMADLQSNQIYWNDWGLIGMTWVLGILTVIGILMYVLKAYRINIGDPHLNCWFIFLFGSSIILFELPREGNFIIQAMALAYLQKLDTGRRYRWIGREEEEEIEPETIHVTTDELKQHNGE